MDSQAVGTAIGGSTLVLITAWQTVRAGAAKKSAEDANKSANEAKQVATDASNKANEASTTKSVAAASDLAKSNADLAAAYKQSADEWKVLAEKTFKEQNEYRQYVHDKAKEDNAVLLSLTAENADLKSKTNLTPLLEHMQKHDANAARVAETLTGLTELIKVLIGEIREIKKV